MNDLALSRRAVTRALFLTNVIPSDGAAHKVRTDACEPHLRAGQWAIIDFTASGSANFLLVKEFAHCPQIVTRQMQAENPHCRILGEVVGLYEEGRAAA